MRSVCAGFGRAVCGFAAAPLAIAGLLLLALTVPAGANGVPQSVHLAYLEALSNWGPQDAEGELEFSFAEGYVRVDVSGLPRLAGQAYEGWLVRSTTNEAISVGQFNAGDDGTAHYEASLPTITDYSLDLFIITVQSLEDAAGRPSQLRSIGGYFAVVQASEGALSGGEVTNGTAAGAGAAGSGGGEAQAANGAAGERPGTLPETGDSTGFVGSTRGLALMVVGGLLILWSLVRTRRRIRRGGGPS